jgi:hypothetical protein
MNVFIVLHSEEEVLLNSTGGIYRTTNQPWRRRILQFLAVGRTSGETIYRVTVEFILDGWQHGLKMLNKYYINKK